MRAARLFPEQEKTVQQEGPAQHILRGGCKKHRCIWQQCNNCTTIVALLQFSIFIIGWSAARSTFYTLVRFCCTWLNSSAWLYSIFGKMVAPNRAANSHFRRYLNSDVALLLFNR
jgi:hypothetical protein